MRVAHVITGLGTGGAETMLVKLVEELGGRGVESYVISLTDRGDFGDRLEQRGAGVEAIGLKRSVLRLPDALLSVGRSLAAIRPDVVQTWMYHADLIGGLSARMSGIGPVLWNVRQSNLDSDLNRPSTMLAMWSCARLSSTLPARIVCNSTAAVRSHRALGYDESRFVVIPNGFDVEVFRPDVESRRRVRDEIGIPSEGVVVGYVARWDRQKDPKNMVLAMAKVMDVRPEVHAILSGSGLSPDTRELLEWVDRTGHRGRFHLLGRRDDIVDVTRAFDVAVSSSVGEGFSNAIGEAMACGVPCVVTSVGDSVAVIGDTGIAVPPSDHERLAGAILRLVVSRELREECGRLARERVVREFSIGSVAARYIEAWREARGCAG